MRTAPGKPERGGSERRRGDIQSQHEEPVKLKKSLEVQNRK